MGTRQTTTVGRSGPRTSAGARTGFRGPVAPNRPASPRGFDPPARRDRLPPELQHGPSRGRQAAGQTVVCPECKAVHRDGVWQWRRPPRGAVIHTCPACRRVLDHAPAGELRLRGPFFAEHEDEVLVLVRNHAERTRREHPIRRLIGIHQEDDAIVARFTDASLTREIGEALESAFQGEALIDESAEDVEVRVTWTR